ncbi:hypothetical protein GCM10020256_70620 [Streptomyces thermocoprophilus]
MSARHVFPRADCPSRGAHNLTPTPPEPTSTISQHGRKRTPDAHRKEQVRHEKRYDAPAGRPRWPASRDRTAAAPGRVTQERPARHGGPDRPARPGDRPRPPDASRPACRTPPAPPAGRLPPRLPDASRPACRTPPAPSGVPRPPLTGATHPTPFPALICT